MCRGAGVTSKIDTQIREWIAQGHEVVLFEVPVRNCAASEPSKNYPHFFLPRQGRARELNCRLSDFKPDLLYLRYQPFSVAIFMAMRNYPSIIELNSDDLEQRKLMFKSGKIGLLRYLHFRLTRGLFLKMANGFVSVTHELLLCSGFKCFEQPSCVVPNSINFNTINSVKNIEKSDRCVFPKILFVGTADAISWHGLDEILSLAKACIGILEFVFVGFEDLGPDYEVSNLSIYPSLADSDFEEIVAMCDIGIASAALFRKKMNEACALKTRDYLARGLPVILPHKDTAFLNLKKDWILELPNEPGSLITHREDIIQFCQKMKNYVVEWNEVEAYIGSDSLESARLDFFEEIIASRG